MKKFKRGIALLIIAVLFVMPLAGCNNDTPKEVEATKIEITNTVTTLTVGEHSLSGKITPQEANQDIVYSLVAPKTGVTLSDKKITITSAAIDNETFEVKAVAKNKTSIATTKTFTVSNPPVVVPVESVAISNTVTDLNVGTTELLATVLPKGADKAVTFSIKTAVTGVSIEDNKIKILETAADNAVITVVVTSVSDTTKKAEKDFTVNNPPKVIPVTGVTITNSAAALGVGEHTLTASVQPSNAIQDVTFSLKSAGDGITLLNNKVTIADTAVHGAKFTVVATSVSDTTKSAEKEFTVDIPVLEVPVTGVTITNTETSINVGSITLTATVQPEEVSQDVTFALQTAVSGITLESGVLTVNATAAHAAQVTVVATSVQDSTVTATKTFTVYNPFVVLTETQKFASIGDVFIIPAVADSDWAVEKGDYNLTTGALTTTTIIDTTFVLDEALNNAESFTVEAKVYKIIYTLKTAPNAKKELIVTGLNAAQVETIKEENCSTATIKGELADKPSTIANDSELKFMGKDTLNVKGKFGASQKLAFTWNSGVYNDLNDVKIYAYNNSESDVTMVSNGESNTVVLKKGMWLGIDSPKGILDWFIGNSFGHTTGYRVANEWKFRFWFSADADIDLDINLAIVLDKGELKPPLIILEKSLLIGQKDVAMDIPQIEGTTYKVFYNGTENAALANAPTLTPDAFGKYEIKYSKTVGEATAEGTCVIMVEDPANTKLVGIDKCGATVGGRTLPTLASDAEIKLNGVNTLKLTGTGHTAIGTDWTSEISSTSTITSVSFYAYNSSDKDIVMSMNVDTVKVTVKPNEWAVYTFNAGDFAWWNTNHGIVGGVGANGYINTGSDVWNFRFMFDVTGNTDYQVNVGLVFNT